jgi:CBS domain-containing protein
MRVSGILADKGDDVATITSTATLAEVAGQLRERGVGALVVSDDGHSIDGIVSERDVVLQLAADGASALGMPVARVMSSEVRTCEPEDKAEDLMRRMTEHRSRHFPVVVDGALAGIVSIGDVVKWRVTELEDETRHLHDYITAGR